jgi:hypothetical protein
MSSYWIWHEIATLEFLPLLPRGCTLYELALDNLILVSRGTKWDVYADVFNNQTKEILLELFKRDRDLPESFKQTPLIASTRFATIMNTLTLLINESV